MDVSKIGELIARHYLLLVITSVIGGFTIIWQFLMNDQIFVASYTLGLPAILGAVLVHFRVDSLEQQSIRIDAVRPKLYLVLFVGLLTASIAVLYGAEGRPLTFFALLGGMYLLILVQIFCDTTTLLILPQILILYLLQVFSVTLRYPLYFGWTDVFGHLAVAEGVSLSGQVGPNIYTETYVNFPLFHILVSQIARITGMFEQVAMYLGLAIPFAMVLVFVYYFSAPDFIGRTPSLLAVLLLSVTPMFVFYGQYIVTRGMAFVGFCILLYLLYKYYNTPQRRYFGLFSIVSVYVLLVHQVSIFQFIPIFGALVVGKAAYDAKRYFEFTFAATLIVMVVGYWMFIAHEMLTLVISLPFSLNAPSPGDVIGGVDTVVPVVEVLRNRVHLFLSMFLSIVGIGICLRQQRSIYLRMVGFAGLLLLPIFIPSPLRYTILADLRIDRMVLFVAPFFAILMGYAVYYLTQVAPWKATRESTLAVLLVVIFLFILVSSMSPLIAYDTTTNNEQRAHFTEAELETISHVNSHVEDGGTLQTDLHLERYFEKYNVRKAEIAESVLGLDMKAFHLVNEFSISQIGTDDHYFIFREEQFKQSTLTLRQEPRFDISAASHGSQVEYQIQTATKIYDAGTVSVTTSN